jgi:hypothetical protein
MFECLLDRLRKRSVCPPSLSAIHLKTNATHGQEPTARVIYFHTKGATQPSNSSSAMFEHHWRMVMEHFVLDLHRSILTTDLNDTSPYAAIGAIFNPVSPGTHWRYSHFSGATALKRLMQYWMFEFFLAAHSAIRSVYAVNVHFNFCASQISDVLQTPPLCGTQAIFGWPSAVSSTRIFLE